MATDTTLKTVERALQVLEIIAREPQPQVREVAECLGYNITSTYHLVNTLLSSGYLTKDASGRLAIGRKIGMLYSSYVRSSDFAETVRPLIAALAEKSGETVYLTRFSQNASVIEMVMESTRSLRVTGLSVGYSGLEDRRASGKAVLAQLPSTQLESVLSHLHPELTPAEISSAIATLDRELESVRVRGYAFDDEQFEEGVCCVAAPFFGVDGTVAGAVAASSPAQRVQELTTTVRDLILTTTAQISELASASWTT